MFYNCYYFARHSSHKIETRYRRNATVWKTPFCSCCWHRSSFLRVRNISDFYRPQRSCGQGNIFTPVCHSFCSQGAGGLPQCILGYHLPGTSQTPPPWDQADIPLAPGRHPQDQADTPQDQADTPWDQADTPGPGRHPPGPGRPPGKQTPAYGLRAAATHPTGMHSCSWLWSQRIFHQFVDLTRGPCKKVCQWDKKLFTQISLSVIVHWSRWCVIVMHLTWSRDTWCTLWDWWTTEWKAITWSIWILILSVGFDF